MRTVPILEMARAYSLRSLLRLLLLYNLQVDQVTSTGFENHCTLSAIQIRDGAFMV